MLIGAAVVRRRPKSTPRRAINLALTPHLAAWEGCRSTARDADGTSVAAVGRDKLGTEGILKRASKVMGGEARAGRLILGAKASCSSSDRKSESGDLLRRGRRLLTFLLHATGKDGFGESPASWRELPGLVATSSTDAPASAAPRRAGDGHDARELTAMPEPLPAAERPGPLAPSPAARGGGPAEPEVGGRKDRSPIP